MFESLLWVGDYMYLKKLALFLFVQVVLDISLNYATYNYQSVQVVIYLKAVVLAVLFFYFLRDILFFVRKKSQLLYQLLLLSFCLVASFGTLVSAMTSKYMNEYLSPYHIKWIQDDLRYLYDYILTFNNMFVILFLMIIIFCLFLYYIFSVSTDYNFSFKRVLVFSPVLMCLSYHLIVHAHRYKIPITVNSFIAFGQHVRNVFSPNNRVISEFKNARKMPFVASKDSLPDSDIILIINESWGVKDFKNSKNNPMPHLAKSFSEDLWTKFPYAFTNSTASEVSVSSILSGISPALPCHILFSMPMISNLSTSKGYRTIYYTSQRAKWGGFDNFLKSGDFSIIKGAEDFSLPTINDTGIDDFLMMKDLALEIEKSSNQKLLIVVFTNALHGPHQTNSEFKFNQKGLNSYEIAMRILDASINEVFKSLKKTNRYDNSLIILTGDHGEVVENTKKLPRLASFYDDFIRVPFYVKKPKHSNLSFKKNSLKNIQNLDIAPTVASFLGYCQNMDTQKFCTYYQGTALFDKIDAQRTIVSLSTNDIRKWDPEGFGIVKGAHRFVVSNLEKPKFFDTTHDPGQKKSLNIAAFENQFNTYIMNSPHLKRIYLQAKERRTF
jgi:glucan phosphoethanolaminetransferase (alkaline phosphatase superfamily)